MTVQQFGEPPQPPRVHSQPDNKTDYSRELSEIPVYIRCDNGACNSQAFIKAYKRDRELFFCRHHGNRHAAGLLGQRFSIQDETFKLNKR